MTQDELKTLVGQAALQYVVPGEIVGVGTGSTVNKLIDALAGERKPASFDYSNCFSLARPSSQEAPVVGS